MGVQVNKGDGDGDMCIFAWGRDTPDIPRSPDCRIMTDLWWGNGCISVCSACSKMPEVTDAAMRKLCKGKWGPIPTENTDLPDEVAT